MAAALLDVADVQAYPVPGLGDYRTDAAAAGLQGRGAAALGQPLRAAAAHPKLPD